MKKHIGFLIKSLGQSQLGFQLTYNLNKLANKSYDISSSVFIKKFDVIPSKPEFSIMQMMYAIGFNGILIATDIDTAKILKHTVGVNKKMFYIWDLEWIYQQKLFQDFADVYLDDKIDLIARSQHHADIISKMWKPPTTIIEDFNYDQIAKLVS